MRVAKITAGAIVNIVIADAPFDDYVAVPDGVGIGWVVNGNGEYEAPAQPPITFTKDMLAVAATNHLNAQAATLGYDSISAAASYAGEPAVARYQTEGKALRKWRSNVWDAIETIFSDIDSDTRGMPTTDEFIAELPAYTG